MFQKILRRVARGLKQASIPYMVIGGQAVLIYGEPRLTRDIDVTLGIGVSELARIKKVLPTMGLKVLVKKDQEFLERTMVLPTKDKESEIRVDFIFSFSPYERQAIEKARDIKIGRTQVKFASLETIRTERSSWIPSRMLLLDTTGSVMLIARWTIITICLLIHPTEIFR